MHPGRQQGNHSAASQGSSSSGTGHASAAYGSHDQPHSSLPPPLPPVRPLSAAPVHQRDHATRHLAYSTPGEIGSQSPATNSSSQAPIHPGWQRPGSHFSAHGQPLHPHSSSPIPLAVSRSPLGGVLIPPARSQTPSVLSSSPSHSPHSPQSKGKQRASDLGPQPARELRRGSVDMRELSSSYRSILEAASLPHMSSADPAQRQQRAETLQHMHQAALTSLRALDPQRAHSLLADRRSNPTSDVLARRDSGSGADGKDGATGGGSPTVRRCLGCDATATPEWRRGPKGPGTLCNACGLVYVKITKQRQAAQSQPGEPTELEVSPSSRRRITKEEDPE
ncbi:hypothetical protein BKA62DRAFT_688566 [Auriculariales sp. MPI-PUGE-AT-0066]|nr:hypothetical protein BKA62DRAFT_688566 [Auriculariales sp. MPI-PUGE-AT-0066]